MARWNLRSAVEAVDTSGTDENGGRDVDESERQHWLELADALFDGYDADSGVYEQFAGFDRLEPLIIAEVAPRRPIAADLLLGAERTSGAQVIKQADVLMLHHLVPDEVVAGSLEPNLRFYEPRTAHGSSLSPAIHASVLARAHDFEPALEALRIAARMDFDDLTGSSAQGLHLATMGGVWQALAFGFMGLRPRAGMLHVDPVLPPTWSALELRLRFHGAKLQMDFFISGNLSEPGDAQEHYRERLILLEGTGFCFGYNALPEPAAGGRPGRGCNLPDEAVVFASGANYFKLIPELLAIWAKDPSTRCPTPRLCSILSAPPGRRAIPRPRCWNSSLKPSRATAARGLSCW